MNQNSKVFTFNSDKLYYKAVDGSKGKEYMLEGYVSTGDLDLVNDIVTKSCMDDMFGQFDNRVIKMDFEHEAFRGETENEAQINKSRIPLGKAVDRYRDEKGLKVVWKMNPNWKKFDSKGDVVMTFKDIWNNIEEGYYDAFSIAYIPTRTADKQIAGKDVRLLDKVSLLNVALTGNPVNPFATMTSVMAKSLDYLKGGDKMGDEIKPAEPAPLPAEPAKEEPKPAEEKPAEPEGKEFKPKKEKEEEDDEEKKKKKKESEKKDTEILEVKSRLETLEKENKALKEIVEKARIKSTGAENKSEKNIQTKSSQGPLDLI